MNILQVNVSRLIQLPLVESTDTFLGGFWQWVNLLAQGHYAQAVESLYWQRPPIDPGVLKQRITTSFGGPDPFVPVIPNERLVRLINENAEVSWANGEGWGLAQIPVTTSPERCKDDDVPLMGLAASFHIRRTQHVYVLEFEIFHA